MAATSFGFCELPAGQRVAYAEMGHGPPLVMLPGWLSHVEQLWSHPSAASARDKFAASRRFIWYDRLGCGMSDRTGFTPSIENDIEQLLAVLDAAGVQRCNLIGYSWGGPAATVFAARYPERVDRLVLYATYARGAALSSQEAHESFTGLLRANWNLGTLTLGTVFIPNASGRDLRWFSRFQRATTSPEMAIALLDEMRRHDVREALTQVRAPTLVLTNRHDPVVHPDNAREIASLVPGSTLHVLDGNEHEPFIRDSGSVVETVIAFLDGRPLHSAPVARPKAGAAALSPREIEVLRLLASGSANKAIARTLGIKIQTVERHIANTYRKVGARGRADAALAAARLGLVDVQI